MSERRSDSFYWSRGEEMPPDPEPASGDVDAARAAIWTANGVNEMIDALDAFEAAIRAESDERVRALREAAQRVCDEADPDWGDEGWIDYLVPFAHVAALHAALSEAEDAHKP